MTTQPATCTTPDAPDTIPHLRTAPDTLGSAAVPGAPDSRTPGEPGASRRPRPTAVLSGDAAVIHVVAWTDPIADPHGLHPCSRYVELYWLGILGPSSTWLLRRLSYGLEVRADGFDLPLAETARALGLGARMGKNSPFRRSIQRLCTFEIARPSGPGCLAVRTAIPPLPLRHLSRLPESLQASHRRWLTEQRLPEAERMRRRAARLASDLANAGRDRDDIERQLWTWRFHPTVAYQAATAATPGPGPALVSTPPPGPTGPGPRR